MFDLNWFSNKELSLFARSRYWLGLITARKRSLGQGYVFTRVCDSVHGGYLGRYTPSGQVHPLGRYPPPPPQVHPSPQAGTPPGRYTPGNTCWDMVNKRTVRILLECILVLNLGLHPGHLHMRIMHVIY